MLNSQIARKLLTCLALSGSLVSILPAAVRADSLPGFTLFSGVGRGDELGYRLDSGNRGATDRYHLRLPGSRINRLGAAQIKITYPDYYKGTFDEKNIEVFVGDKSIPVSSVTWDKERKTLEINLAQQLKTKGEVEVVLSNVRNPDGGGMYYFDCEVKSSPEFPVARYLGTWILSIN